MGPYSRNIRLGGFLWIGLLWLGWAVNAIGQENRIPAQRTDKKNVIEMTFDELRQSYHHQLGSVEFNPNQSQLNYLLEKVGENVIAFFRNFSNTSSKEWVEVSKLRGSSQLVGHSGHIMEYQYLILPGSGNNENFWTEYRTDKKNRPVDPKAISGYIMSSGYAGHCLYLHPSHQANSNFRYLGREKNKSRAHVIAFAQKPESKDYLAYFGDPSSKVRFLVQGFVWVAPDNYQVLRMYTRMLLPERETSLKETTTDISYERVRLGVASREFWLPREVYVDWGFPGGLKYISRHKYSDYHLFTVQSDYKITQPKADK